MEHITGEDRSKLLLLPDAVDDYVGPGSSDNSGTAISSCSRSSTGWPERFASMLEIPGTRKERGAGVWALNEPIIDTTTPSGEFVRQIFGVSAPTVRRYLSTMELVP